MPSPQQLHQMLITANAHQRAGRLAEAEPLYRNVLRFAPRNTDALYLLGMLLNATQRYAEAVPLFELAIKVDPTRAKYHANLAAALGAPGLGRIDEAITWYQKAIALEPTLAELHNNLGNEFRAADRWDEAIESYHHALQLKPDYADAWSNYGVALQEISSTPQQMLNAIAAYEKAISLDPNFALAHWNLGIAHLLCGDFARGLSEYEWRWRNESFGDNFRYPVQGQWGTPEGMGYPDVAGRTILLYSEQGLGDSIHFIRYAKILADRGAKILVRCPPSLHSLLARCPGVHGVFSCTQDAMPHDWHIPMMSLPYALGTRVETIPTPIPYVSPDPQRSQSWKSRIDQTVGERGGKLRVGLAWAGNPKNKNDRNRSLRLSQLAPLARAADSVDFFSLQKNPPADQIAQGSPGIKLIDFTAELTDFAETAALVDHLDLVICVDTAVAHLAGAMGKPVWLLIPFMPDWRWMLQRSDSPWYPSMRIFRQSPRGDWTGAIEQVAQALIDSPPIPEPR